MSDINIRSLSTLESVSSGAWDGLEHGHSPFQRYGFLMALEKSGSVGPASGWHPHYLLVEQVGRLIGACAAYVKTDSYGEYIFDWAWAQAAQHFSVDYYPKLVVAAPFTPAAGHRFLVAPGQEPVLIRNALLAGIRTMIDQYQLSGAHVLFCTEEEAAAIESQGVARRTSFQFHWRNRGYKNFDDFLGALKSRKRKQIRKERERAQNSVEHIEFISGAQMQDEDLAALDRFYRKTVREHGGFDYLRPGFFEKAQMLIPELMLFCRVRLDGRIVAGAIFFETESALYGRYWGSDEKFEFLHFEVAYYAAIERCIRKGIGLFEAGAQGEHKLLRGFEPEVTHSCHIIANPAFDRAIRAFLTTESDELQGHMQRLAAAGPYRSDD